MAMEEEEGVNVPLARGVAANTPPKNRSTIRAGMDGANPHPISNSVARTIVTAYTGSRP